MVRPHRISFGMCVGPGSTIMTSMPNDATALTTDSIKPSIPHLVTRAAGPSVSFCARLPMASVLTLAGVHA
jgi:hypothetical protein